MQLCIISSQNNTSIIVWKVAGELVRPKNMTRHSNNPLLVLKAVFHSSPSLMRTLLYPHLMLSLVNHFFLTNLVLRSVMRGNGYVLRIVQLLSVGWPCTVRKLASFLLTEKKGDGKGLFDRLVYPLA